jgi:hypothetical protein
VTLQSNLIKQENPTNQRLGAPGVGEVVRRAVKAAWLATKAFPKAEVRVGINDLPIEITIMPDWNEKVPDKDSVLNKSERIYKVDQAVESHLLLQPYVKSWAH